MPIYFDDLNEETRRKIWSAEFWETLFPVSVMYSPKIREDLVRRLYQEAKKREMPMTELVNEIIEEELEKQE